MSLAGLLSVIADDPQLRRALDLASTGEDAGGPGGAGRGPAGGAAGLAGLSPDGDSGGGDLVGPAELRPFLAAALAALAGRFVLAVTATAREADDLTAALGSRCCAGWLIPILRTRWPAPSRWWSRRSAGCCSRSSPGSGTSSRYAWPQTRPPIRTRCSPGSSTS